MEEGKEQRQNQQQGSRKVRGGGNKGWSALTEDMKWFGTVAITQEFSKELPKCQADVGGESTKCAKFKIQAVEATKLWVFVSMVKGDVELKTFHSILKYNDLFVAKNISGNLILSCGIVHWKEGRVYSRFHGTRHGHGLT